MTTKEKLVESAKKLIAEKGYNDTKVEDITQNAEVAKGTFYTYFKTKEDIFIELVKTVFETGELILSQMEFSENLKENLHKFIGFMAKGASKDAYAFRIISNIFNNSQLMEKFMKIECCFREGYKKYVKTLLEASKNEVREDALENFEYIYAPIDGFIKIYIGELVGLGKNFGEIKSLSEEELEIHVKFLVEFLYRALKK